MIGGSTAGQRNAGSVVVANPSSTPEAIHAAAALADAGLLDRYHVPLAPTERQFHRIERLLPSRLAQAVLRELRRRELPASIPPSAAQQVGTLSDLIRVAARRAPIGDHASQTAGRYAVARFDAGVAARLQSGDGAILAIAGCAARSTAAAHALGVRAVIDCPLGHHGYVRDVMRQEERLQPEWAPTLQMHDIPDAELDAHARELRTSDRVLALSRFSANTLRERGVDPEKIELTPLGVDTSLFRPGPRPADDTFRVIFVGQISQRKGLSYLVSGFERAALASAELVLIGQVIGDPAEWAARNRIAHVPAMPRAELPRQYHRADVFVLPSLVEGFGLTALEAMACGLPIIISMNTFADDVITDGVEGFIVPIRDADAITERLQLLESDPDLRVRMGAAARRTAERFDWTGYGDRVVAIMRRLLGERGDGQGGAH